MNRQERPILHSGIAESFHRLNEDAKLDQLARFNLSLTTYGSESEQLQVAFQQIQELGFTPVRLYSVLQGMAWLMHREQIIMPSGKKLKQERGKITEDILNRMHFEEGEDNNLRVNVQLENGDVRDILAEASLYEEMLEQNVAELSTDTMILGRVLQRIKNLAKERTLLAFEENIPGQVPVRGPRILLQPYANEASADMRRRADRQISTSEPQAMRFGLLREVVRQGQIDVRRQELAQALERREIITVPKFKLENWPTDALMGNARKQVATVVDSYIARNNVLCDPQDLKYQTLFRLTTHDIPGVYENGQELDGYLQDQGAYVNWRNILNLDARFVKQFRIKPDVLMETIEEQYTIIRQRLKNSSLPIERILPRSGMFAETGWVIQKRSNGIFAAQEEGITAASDLVPLEFREIDPELAKQYHNDLHYIHTPRADVAFGLYAKGDDLPFSVLAMEKIDRPYKQNVLLMQGFDPRNCYDLTRLYSRPGTPANTSSSMFSLAFNSMKNNYPETQAVVSAFMPSYATGVSMTSGGFDNPILIKPLVHSFEERTIDGNTSWEHVTKRRQEDSGSVRIRSKFPLLPTVELMSSLQTPRYTPLSETKDFMIEVV